MKIKNIFDKIKGKEIIIIGDSMVDSYVIGEINRNSPEAPVPIVDIQKEDKKYLFKTRQICSQTFKFRRHRYN